MPRADSPDAEDALKQQEQHSIQDFELPKTIVTRIAKAALPDNAKLQKEAVTALVMSSTVFINYLAATAQDVTWSRSAKTITAQDVLKALEIIEFDDQVEPMKRELAAWKAAQDPKSKAKKKAAEENGTSKSGKRKSKAAAEQEAEEEVGEHDEHEGQEGHDDGEGEEHEGEEEEGAEGEGEGEEGDEVEGGEEGEGEGEDEEMDEDEPPEEDVTMDVEDRGRHEDEHGDEED